MNTCRMQQQHEHQERLGEQVLRVAEVDAEHVHVVEAEDHREELPGEVVHRGEDRDQPEQVEPAGEPAPHRAAELGRPPVDAARGRERGDELGHAQRDDEDEGRDDRPAPRDRDRTAVVPRLVVGREAAGQDRDDRERDAEVLEPASRCG